MLSINRIFTSKSLRTTALLVPLINFSLVAAVELASGFQRTEFVTRTGIAQVSSDIQSVETRELQLSEGQRRLKSITASVNAQLALFHQYAVANSGSGGCAGGLVSPPPGQTATQRIFQEDPQGPALQQHLPSSAEDKSLVGNPGNFTVIF